MILVGLRRRDVPARVVVLDTAFIFTIGAGTAAPTEVVGFLYTTMHVRNLYGTHLTAVIRTVAFGAMLATLAAVMAWQHGGPGPASVKHHCSASAQLRARS